MSKIALIHNSDIEDLLIGLSLAERLKREKHDVTLFSDDLSCKLAQYNVTTGSIFTGVTEKYDVAINISNSIVSSIFTEKLNSDIKLGYKVNETIDFYNKNTINHYNVKYLQQNTKSNMFQLLFGIADMTWKGEGYIIRYFPRNKTMKSLTGIYIDDSNLKDLIINNLKLTKSKLSPISYKQNILKKFNEVNRYKRIITDNKDIMHIGLALRKYTQIILYEQLPYRLETFGYGDVYV